MQDYQDNLFTTVSLNATGYGAEATAFPAIDTAHGSMGQFLLASPSLFNPALPSGQMSVWGSYIAGSPANYYTSDMLTSALGECLWPGPAL